MTENKCTKSLIIGATGQVGSQILLELGAKRSIPTSRRVSRKEWLSLDLACIKKTSDISNLLEGSLLDAVYCVGGMTNVELCESEPQHAMDINCTGPSIIAKFCFEQKLQFIYFSTEYVFDGLNGPYTEDALVSPVSVYGMSKLAGEMAVRNNNPDAIVIRTTVVYGPDPGAKNFLANLRRSLQVGKTVLVSNDQLSTPTYNIDLAKAAIKLVEKKASGLINIAGHERLSRLDFSLMAAGFWGLDASRIKGMPTTELGQVARRPLLGGLDTSRLRQQHPEILMRSLDDALRHWSNCIN